MLLVKVLVILRLLLKWVHIGDWEGFTRRIRTCGPQIPIGSDSSSSLGIFSHGPCNPFDQMTLEAHVVPNFRPVTERRVEYPSRPF